ncbi:MAG: hypothetical protein IPG84_19845 [Betaproteobacteria bacterium]|nr:hypothetical protein [Betaproteobacteria bacterium]
MPIAHAALTIRMFGESVSPATVTSRKRTGTYASVWPLVKRSAGNGVTLPSSTGEEPLATLTVCASDHDDVPPRIANDIGNEPLRGAPFASVSLPW